MSSPPMSKISQSFFLGTSFLFLSLFAPTNAELVGCRVINCPKVNGFDSCILGNATLTSIGSIPFNTSLTPLPLTWTVGFESKQELKSTTSSDGSSSGLGGLGGSGTNSGNNPNCGPNAQRPSQQPDQNCPATTTFAPTSILTLGEVDYRSYYLGTPPGFDFSTTGGCALFFEGVAGNITFPGPTPRTDVGTCEDALGATCVVDLIAQARRSVVEIASNPSSTEGTCGMLAKALRSNAPVTCKDAKNQSWGDVVVKSFGDPSILLNLPPAPCSPTTGNNYNLSLIQTTKGEETAITPILTVLMNAASTVEPEVSLHCLKPVGGPLPEVARPSAVGAATSGGGRLGVFGLWGWVLVLGGMSV